MHVIGTAGHVDHGKSTLVRALTGIDPDRLAEEKRREMTIDLGFAWFQLDDEEIGVVDVPGHRDFIENMLAGVGGIDLALLVIAADEGVMPQTQEHLAILDLLGVESGIIALTKIDLVEDQEWIELISLDIAEALIGSTLAGAPIVPVSTRTGEGLPQLREQLSKQLARTAARLDSGRPRLPIDRVFTLSGFGTVVTGTLLDGSLRVGELVEIVPDGKAARIRGLQTHRTKRDVARPGSRVAINLAGIDHHDLRRGQVVSMPGQLQPTTLLDVSYRHLAVSEHPLKHNTDVKVFIGSAEVSGRVRVLGRDVIEPGQEGWLQLALVDPVAASRGDRYVLRRPSPGETMGGGIVLDANPGRRHRRFRPDVLARFDALQASTPDELIMQMLLRGGAVERSALIERAGLTSADAGPVLNRMSEGGQIRHLGKFVAASTIWLKLGNDAIEMVRKFHAEYPFRQGMNREELRNHLNISAALFNFLVAELVENQKLVEPSVLLALPEHSVIFTPVQQTQIDALLVSLHEAGVDSPGVKECRELVGDEVFAALVDQGILIQIGQDIVYDRATYAHIRSLLLDFLQKHGAITAAQARDLMGTSRKYAIALLEHLDELRITRRIGDERVLVSTKLA